MRIRETVLVVLVAASALVSGCASVPMASEQEDARAKRFEPAEGKANIYVYRNESMGAAVRMEVDLDGQQVGVTAAKSYLLLDVEPGKHTLVSHAENDDSLELEAKAGQNHFVWQEVKMGVLYGRTKLHLVDAETGMAGVKECKLVDGPASMLPQKK